MKNELDTINNSLFFQILIISGGLISIFATDLKRRQLVADVCGEEVPEFPITKIRIGASIMVLTSLIYFFLLSQQDLQEAATPLDCLSANINSIASFLVLVASAIRLYDIGFLSQINDDALTESIELPVI